MIKDNQSFHKRHIFIKMANPLLVLMRMLYLNHPHMYKLQFMVLMVDGHISMSMLELNNEDCFSPVTDLKYYKYKEGPGDDEPSGYFPDDEDVSNAEDGIPCQDNNRFGGKILTVWEMYKPLLEHDCSKKEYMLYVGTKAYAHAKVIVLYIYANYHVIFFQFVILKIIQLCLTYMQEHYTSEYHMAIV